jgi:ubiquinone/menaquinone biosynthesis C-methylase UbiE
MLAVAQARATRARFKAGSAERLPYPAGFFDLVFSVDVIHHVLDQAAYYHQAYRVLRAGGKLCTVTDTKEIIRRRQPLSAYFPETSERELQRYPRISTLRAMMVEAGFGRLKRRVVEHRYSVTSAQPYRDKAFSSLHLIPEEALKRGVQRMEQDLCHGPIPGVARYLLLWGTK